MPTLSCGFTRPGRSWTSRAQPASWGWLTAARRTSRRSSPGARALVMGTAPAAFFVNFLLDQPVRFSVRRLTAGLVRPFEQAGHGQGLAGPRRPASEGDASGLTMDSRLGSLVW